MVNMRLIDVIVYKSMFVTYFIFQSRLGKLKCYAHEYVPYANIFNSSIYDLTIEEYHQYKKHSAL